MTEPTTPTAPSALIDSTAYCSDHLATAGVMTRRAPTPAQWDDIRHGWQIGQALSRMDVGQSIAVLNRDVIAVEALEGTNAMIERAGSLCRVGGWTLIKVSNSDQDMRMDVPSVGTTTIEKLMRSPRHRRGPHRDDSGLRLKRIDEVLERHIAAGHITGARNRALGLR